MLWWGKPTTNIINNLTFCVLLSSSTHLKNTVTETSNHHQQNNISKFIIKVSGGDIVFSIICGWQKGTDRRKGRSGHKLGRVRSNFGFGQISRVVVVVECFVSSSKLQASKKEQQNDVRHSSCAPFGPPCPLVG